MSEPARIARIFPRRTVATPDDALAFTTPPPKELPEIDELHVSVAFTYDMPCFTAIQKAWLIRRGLSFS